MREPLPSIPVGTSLAGKTVIVTGGNSGLGWEFARQALVLNASRVIITTRTQAKGCAAIAALRNDPEVKSTNSTARPEFFDLDLDDYESGQEFVQRVKDEVSELDILLCNGGVNFFNYQTSKSGHERIMQVNSYTHFLIVLSLLPLVQATAFKRGSPSRVTFLSSFSHMQHDMEANPVAADKSVLGHFDDKEKFRGMRRYQNSKLMINAFVQRLATIVPSSEVIVNAVCPGVIATRFNRTLPCWIKPAMFVYWKLNARPVDEGARVVIHAAALTDQESHGKYLQSGKIHRGAPFLLQPTGKEVINKLWAEVVAECRKINPELGIYA